MITFSHKLFLVFSVTLTAFTTFHLVLSSLCPSVSLSFCHFVLLSLCPSVSCPLSLCPYYHLYFNYLSLCLVQHNLSCAALSFIGTVSMSYLCFCLFPLSLCPFSVCPFVCRLLCIPFRNAVLSFVDFKLLTVCDFFPKLSPDFAAALFSDSLEKYF